VATMAQPSRRLTKRLLSSSSSCSRTLIDETHTNQNGDTSAFQDHSWPNRHCTGVILSFFTDLSKEENKIV
jgi:hypothetical protein